VTEVSDFEQRQRAIVKSRHMHAKGYHVKYIPMKPYFIDLARRVFLYVFIFQTSKRRWFNIEHKLYRDIYGNQGYQQKQAVSSYASLLAPGYHMQSPENATCQQITTKSINQSAYKKKIFNDYFQNRLSNVSLHTILGHLFQ